MATVPHTYGELLLAPYGRNIIIADRADDKPLEKNGKFIAVLPDDLSADRWVKAVEKIEVIKLKQKTAQAGPGILREEEIPSEKNAAGDALIEQSSHIHEEGGTMAKGKTKLIIASTTSTQNSGLLDILDPCL